MDNQRDIDEFIKGNVFNILGIHLFALMQLDEKTDITLHLYPNMKLISLA